MQTNDTLTIAGKTYTSRLLVGTGKYKDLEETRLATLASGAQIITVAVRRTMAAASRTIGLSPAPPASTTTSSSPRTRGRSTP